MTKIRTTRVRPTSQPPNNTSQPRRSTRPTKRPKNQTSQGIRLVKKLNQSGLHKIKNQLVKRINQSTSSTSQLPQLVNYLNQSTSSTSQPSRLVKKLDQLTQSTSQARYTDQQNSHNFNLPDNYFTRKNIHQDLDRLPAAISLLILLISETSKKANQLPILFAIKLQLKTPTLPLVCN